MPNGKLREYYARITAFLAECSDYLDTEHSAFIFPDEDDVEIRGRLKATIVFRDGSQLKVRALLDDIKAIREYDYAYIYYDPHGKRIFQYDDAPHHPEIPTYPHHLHRGERPRRGKERVYAMDLPRVDFIAMVDKAIGHVR